METIDQTLPASFNRAINKPSVFKKFINWCEGQSENQFMWLGIALAGHGCILTPITVMAVLLAGTNLFLFMLALTSMGLALVTNLAAMPTKITIPVFFLTVLIDILIIVATLIMGFDITSTYV
jgi:hypothetical protein